MHGTSLSDQKSYPICVSRLEFLCILWKNKICLCSLTLSDSLNYESAMSELRDDPSIHNFSSTAINSREIAWQRLRQESCAAVTRQMWHLNDLSLYRKAAQVRFGAAISDLPFNISDLERTRFQRHAMSNMSLNGEEVLPRPPETLQHQAASNDSEASSTTLKWKILPNTLHSVTSG